MRSWTVVVPVKQLGAAKTRLDRPDRAEMALAMACDTVAAAAACPLVRQVVVVTDDPRATAALDGAARIVTDEPDRGLNPALAHGATNAARGDPASGVVALAADLPALRPAELTAALEAAADLDRALLADDAGVGSVLLLAAPGVPLDPRFGPGSRAAHAAAGAVDLTGLLGDRVRGLRRDVDTVSDLEDAARLGVGPQTARLLRTPIHAAPTGRQATVRSWDADRAEGVAVTDDGDEVVLPAGSRLVGLRRLRPGQRVRVRGGGEGPAVVSLVTSYPS